MVAATETEVTADNIGDKKMILLISSDGERLELPEEAAKLSCILRNMIEDNCADDDGIDLPLVAGKPLAKIVEYCTKHAAGGMTEEELKRFDGELIDVDTDMLYDLFTGANFMGVEGLLSLAAQRTVELITGKSPEEIRKTFRITNDFTPEQEAEIINENQWAFQ